jgi:predicted DNA-binding protein (UPF0251 family)
LPRPFKCRRVAIAPGVSYFKPRGVPMSELAEVNLTVDEWEALRLADLDGLYQEEAARRMNVSRQTFGNIINAAHRKIADSIINSKAIKIEGGVYRTAEARKFTCRDCRHEWEAPHGETKPRDCPRCRGLNIYRSKVDHDGGPAAGPGFGKCQRRTT